VVKSRWLRIRSVNRVFDLTLTFFLSGRGEMWRKQEGREEIVPIDAGICLTIPLGTHFQFRSFGDQALAALGTTMPPWPGEGEAMLVEGKWKPTLP
jgi:mannose-6-phosphate isomerase-like protein (cupin superfamily)